MSRNKSSAALSPQAAALPAELVRGMAIALLLERKHIPEDPDTAADYDTVARAIGARLTMSGWTFHKKPPVPSHGGGVG